MTLDVIAFGCTSASMVIGPSRVAAICREAKPGVKSRLTCPMPSLSNLKMKRLHFRAFYFLLYRIHLLRFICFWSFYFHLFKATNPLEAGIFALKTLKISRMGLITPYRSDLNQQLKESFESAGIQVVAMASFNEEDDNNVGRISPDSIGTIHKLRGQLHYLVLTMIQARLNSLTSVTELQCFPKCI